MKFAAVSFISGLLGAASQTPVFSVDLNGLIVAALATIGGLVGAGIISTRRSRAKMDAEKKQTQVGTESQAILTHAQYEGFISEAAERLNTMQEATLARLEKELAVAQKHIAELEKELEKAKGERNVALAESALRERELKAEIEQLRDRIADLERRLEAQGITPRRARDERATPRPHAEDEPSDGGG